MEALESTEGPLLLPSPRSPRRLLSPSSSSTSKDDGGLAAAHPYLTLASLGWAMLVVGAVTGYMALALNGGAVELVLRLNRWGGARDIYSTAASHGRVYALHPFQEMFFPLHVAKRGPRRSLAVFTAGRDGLENVDRLVRAWGSEHFDYMICHFDTERMADWAALPWYKQAVGFYAHRQGKMWFFKRALTPALVEEYEYVHFIDSDAGSPAAADDDNVGPFSLWAYERVLRGQGVVLGQPAVTNKAKTSAHAICRQENDSLLRWTTFVENGPLFSVHVQSGGFASVWEMVDPLSVSGYGVDFAWCAYLYEQKGFARGRTCAIVDAHPIDHIDTHSATSQLFGAPGGSSEGQAQLDYATWGRVEWSRYARILGRRMLQDWRRMDVLRRVPLGHMERRRGRGGLEEGKESQNETAAAGAAGGGPA